MRHLLLIRTRSKIHTHIILRQLVSMVHAGIPLIHCLDILEKNQRAPAAHSMLHQIKLKVQAGYPLHESLRQHSDWFDAFTCRLIQLGEQTGKLVEVLDALALHHENIAAFRRSIRQTLFYPVILLSVSILLTSSMFIFVIPAFADLFKDMDKPLPFITQLIFAFSRTLMLTMPFALPVSAIVLFILARIRKKSIRELLFNWLLLLPVVAHYRQTLAIIHFCKHLSLSLSAGMPILNALQLSSGHDQPPAVLSAVRQIRAALTAGTTLHHAMQSQTIFPELLLQMIKSGEESGTLESMLRKSADLMEAEVNSRMIQFSRLLEPLIMAVLGVLIGGLVIGMYLPVFNLGSVL